MTEVPSSPEQNPQPSVVIDSNATVKKSRLPIFAAAAVVVALVAFTVVYFVTKDSGEYKPGPVAQSMLDSLQSEGIEIELSDDELKCIDREGEGIDPELIANGTLDTIDATENPELAAFAGKVYDKCFERASRIDLFAAGMVADGSGTPEQAQCAAAALDDAVMDAGGFEALLGDEGGEQLMGLVFGLMGAMAECGIEMMGD